MEKNRITSFNFLYNKTGLMMKSEELKRFCSARAAIKSKMQDCREYKSLKGIGSLY